MLKKPATLLFAAGAVGLGWSSTAQGPKSANAGAATPLKAVRLASGLRLRYLEQGPASAPAVIMLHGYTDTSFSFSRVLPLLPSSLRVIVPDQRGHGQSDRPESGYSIPDFATDVVQLLDALRIPRASLVGHSMGHLVARQVALAAPDRVERLVLLSGGPVYRNAVIDDLRKAVDGLTDPVGPAFARDFQESTVHRPVPAEFIDRVVADSAAMPARIWKAALEGQMSHTVNHAAIARPSLVIGGDRDAVFSRAELEQVGHAIPGATLRILPDVGHAPHWEQPDLIARAIADFLAAPSGTR